MPVIVVASEKATALYVFGWSRVDASFPAIQALGYLRVNSLQGTREW